MSDQRDDADRGAVDRGSTGATASELRAPAPASGAAPGSPRSRWASPAAPPSASAGASAARRPSRSASELQQRAAEQLFRVLGELKGGAMKFGQALSLFESVLPEDVAAPYRGPARPGCRTAAPPMPTSRVHAVLARELGRGLAEVVHRASMPFPAAAASIGQVHRGDLARRADGRGEGAVPGRRRGAALRPATDRPAVEGHRAAGRRDGRQRRWSTELTARVSEELDYTLEARRPAAGGRGIRRAVAEFFVPHVLAAHDEGDGQ